jgi:DNA modification methylase
MMPDLYNADCMDLLPYMQPATIDLILADLPYGTTQNKWDSVIPLAPLWEQYRRIIKPGGAIVLTAAQPFTSVLTLSNIPWFRYDLIWEKTTASGHLNAKRQPLRAHESILVFCDRKPPYFPQKTFGHARKTAMRVDRGKKRSECYGEQNGITHYDSTERYPRSVIKTSTDKQRSKLHPTQKPVALMEWLILTYSEPGAIVLDNAMGSGTTGVACVNLGRKFIGIERDKLIFEKAKTRLKA